MLRARGACKGLCPRLWAERRGPIHAPVPPGPPPAAHGLHPTRSEDTMSSAPLTLHRVTQETLDLGPVFTIASRCASPHPATHLHSASTPQPIVNSSTPSHPSTLLHTPQSAEAHRSVEELAAHDPDAPAHARHALAVVAVPANRACGSGPRGQKMKGCDKGLCSSNWGFAWGQGPGRTVSRPQLVIMEHDRQHTPISSKYDRTWAHGRRGRHGTPQAKP